MALNFKLKDIIHKVTAKFFHAFLPEAKKPYYLHVVNQTELDVHGIASKADVYNITTEPAVIEEGLTSGMELMFYLAADGYKLKTPVFNFRLGIPGEYLGTETHLPEGVTPVGRLSMSPEFRKYLAERVQVLIDGVEEHTGLIAQTVDLATGEVDNLLTINETLVILGSGLKVSADALHAADTGVYFEAPDGTRVKQEARHIIDNQPRTLKVTVTGLTPNVAYYVVVRTQSTVKSGGSLLKDVREMKSDFTLMAQ
jgi:hypothetical protein